MLTIHQFPCLNDNYGYLAHDTESGETAAIDTPDADKYLAEAASKGWTITAIWNTHWHPDHAGGNLKIKETTGCDIIGPKGEAEKIPGIDRAVGAGDIVTLGALQADVIEVPGHTLGHIAFHLGAAQTAFVGDAVFALGCGRVFEGDMPMMWKSMQAIKALPPETTLYCAHEYTQANARFAETIETDNRALRDYISEIDDNQSRGEWTIPINPAKELATHPVLRPHVPHLPPATGHTGAAAAPRREAHDLQDLFS